MAIGDLLFENKIRQMESQPEKSVVNQCPRVDVSRPQAPGGPLCTRLAHHGAAWVTSSH